VKHELHLVGVIDRSDRLWRAAWAAHALAIFLRSLDLARLTARRLLLPLTVLTAFLAGGSVLVLQFAMRGAS